MERFSTFSEILSSYLNESQTKDFMRKSEVTFKQASLTGEIPILNPQFLISRRIQIENLLTITEKELPKIKYVDLYLYLSKFSINIGLSNLAEDILSSLIKKIGNKEKLKDYVATAYFHLGEIYFRQGYWKKSEKNISIARKIFNEEKNRWGILRCDNLSGALHGEKGNLTKALNNFIKSKKNINPKKEKYVYSMIESNIGILYQALHKFDESILYLNRALVYYEQIKDQVRISELKYNIANLFYLKKEYTLANSKLDEAIRCAAEAENLSLLSLCFVTKADTLVNLKDLDMANAVIDMAMEISTKINDRLSIAEVYKITGKIELEICHFDSAENFLLTSFRLNKELENLYNLAETCLSLAKVYEIKHDSKQSNRFKKLAAQYWKSFESVT